MWSWGPGWLPTAGEPSGALCGSDKGLTAGGPVGLPEAIATGFPAGRALVSGAKAGEGGVVAGGIRVGESGDGESWPAASICEDLRATYTSQAKPRGCPNPPDRCTRYTWQTINKTR